MFAIFLNSETFVRVPSSETETFGFSYIFVEKVCGLNENELVNLSLPLMTQLLK